MLNKYIHNHLRKCGKVPNGFQRRNMHGQQGELVETLSKLSKDIRAMKDVRAKKVELASCVL